MDKPTYLYIKQHSITKKLYFGKTTKNPEKYYGSGIRWLKHINKHGKQYVETIWYCLFFDMDELIKCAVNWSNIWDIVNSDDWLNQTPETGIGGGGRVGHPAWNRGIPCAETTKNKLRQSMIGKKFGKCSEERKKNISKAKKGKCIGENNSFFGKSHSTISKEKISKANSGKIQTDEHRKKNSEGVSKLKWYNNGTEQCRCLPENSPIGWVNGRLYSKRKSRNQ